MPSINLGPVEFPDSDGFIHTLQITFSEVVEDNPLPTTSCRTTLLARIWPPLARASMRSAAITEAPKEDAHRERDSLRGDSPLARLRARDCQIRQPA